MAQNLENAICVEMITAMNEAVTYADNFYEWDGKNRYAHITDKRLKKEIRMIAAEDAKNSIIRATLELLKITTDTEIDNAPPFWRDEPEADQYREYTPIAFQNGILLFEKWLAGEKEYFIPPTPLLFVINPLPYDYDPSAKCPEFEEWMSWFSGHPDKVVMIQRFLGSILLGLRVEKFLWLQGLGANGKSTLTGLIGHVFGDDNIGRVVIDDLNKSFVLESLIGCCINISEEFTTISRAVENSIKRIVSHQIISVNRKWRPVQRLQLGLSLILVSNSVPHIADRTDGFYRRLLFHRCDARPEKLEIDYPNRLMAEASGIFNWVLAGAREVYELRDIPVPEVVQEHIDEIRLDFDPIKKFLLERYVVTNDPDDFVPTVPAYAQFKEWSEENGYNLSSSSTFIRRLKDLTQLETDRRARNRVRQTALIGLARRSDVESEIRKGKRSIDLLPESEFKRELAEDLKTPEAEQSPEVAKIQKRIDKARNGEDDAETTDADELVDFLEGGKS